MDPIQITKDIFLKIKASDPAALLVPIKNQGESSKYINEPVYIPKKKKIYSNMSPINSYEIYEWYILPLDLNVLIGHLKNTQHFDIFFQDQKYISATNLT